ncbi:MAG: IgGFc-binding protein, partial [Nannocystaceae bacterium]
SSTQQCVNGGCLELCQIASFTPSSIGCSFVAHHMDNFNSSLVDSIIAGNFSDTLTANLTIYVVQQGSNIESPVTTVSVGPGQTYEFVMGTPEIESVSELRTGGVYRLESDIPIVAYQHSPVGSNATNDASMLIPENAQGQSFIVASYSSDLPSYPPYLNVIALEDNTNVSWTPPVNTQGGTGVNPVTAGSTGTVVMNRFDRLQIVPTSGADISGTIVESDKKVAVWGGSECENVPSGVTFCDHIEEQMLPLNYWGQYYVGAHAPIRGNEDFHWRVYAGKDLTTISTTPAQPGFPVTLNKGEFISLVTTEDVIFSGDGPFLPVQYLEGQDGGAGTGDPSMYQIVPVGQFLSAYAFATGVSTNYVYTHYVQVTRTLNGPEVLVDGTIVTGYRTIGNYQVADWIVSEGSHFATSSAPFGITSIGYAGVTSYAYPGGMNLLELNPQ